MALWLYGFMALWLYGFMALWLYGLTALWLRDYCASPRDCASIHRRSV